MEPVAMQSYDKVHRIGQIWLTWREVRRVAPETLRNTHRSLETNGLGDSGISSGTLGKPATKTVEPLSERTL